MLHSVLESMTIKIIASDKQMHYHDLQEMHPFKDICNLEPSFLMTSTKFFHRWNLTFSWLCSCCYTSTRDFTFLLESSTYPNSYIIQMHLDSGIFHFSSRFFPLLFKFSHESFRLKDICNLEPSFLMTSIKFFHQWNLTFSWLCFWSYTWPCL